MKRIHRLVLGLAALTLCATETRGALAQPVDPADLDLALEAQMTTDATPLPAGMGAVLVASLTGSDREPPVIVLAEGEQVALGRTGERIVLPPGRYEVAVGHGALEHWARATVRVEEGMTTPVSPFFGAVRVNLVDDDGKPVADEYVLRSIDLGTTYGPVSTSDRPDAATTPTWALPPGRYVLALGSDANTDHDSMAFSLHAAELLRYRLVVAGGELVRSELHDEEYSYEPSIWRLRWNVGGTGMLDSRNDGLTHTGRQYALLGLFSRFEGGIDAGDHLALLRFNVDQSFLALDDELGADVPFRTLNNEAELEVLYNYRVARIFGPYARAIARTSFFESHYFPDTDVVLNTFDEDGNLVYQGAGSRGDRIRLFKSFAPTTIQEGVGLSLSPIDNDIFDLTIRAGGAARQAFYRDGRLVTAREGDTLSLMQLDNRPDGLGAEGTAMLGLRVARMFSIASRFDSFLPYQLFTGDEKRFPFRWDSTASLGFGQYLSTNYTFSVRRDEVVMDEVQLTHGLSLAVQASIF